MKQSLGSWRERWASPAFWLAVFFGSGLLKPAPGTWGSLAGLGIGYLMIAAGASAGLFVAAIVTVSLVGTLAINSIERQCGVHDAPEIVIDEVAGVWIALLPAYHIGPSSLLFVAAFVLFRFFDILKPWPIGWLDKKISGGFGVMVDDIVAGVFAIIGIEILSIFILL